MKIISNFTIGQKVRLARIRRKSVRHRVVTVTGITDRGMLEFEPEPGCRGWACPSDVDPYEGTPGPDDCRTCGSEIVATINDSHFRMKECDACERRRYETQPELLEHLRNIVEMTHSVSANWESGDLADAVRNLERIATAAEIAIDKAA